MYKALLYICLSLLPLYGLAQSPSLEQAGPMEAIAEDANHIISNILCSSQNNTTILLTWKVPGKTPDFFAIERSDNGRSFETVTVLNNVEEKPVYQWTDEAPKKGKSFYRIRYSFEQEKPLYSRTVSFFIAGYVSFKFYPNPVDHILIVRSDTPIDVQITDGNGRTRISEARVQGLHTINVSSLEKGIYLIRFSNKLTNVISQEKLMKN
ncbi:MAG: T9SS type A sorting domain-containing protein [Chitinophagaceae bacterium]|nr:T9SS type A sorting domain-containing protein [Chitinophagaceae bacterium]